MKPSVKKSSSRPFQKLRFAADELYEFRKFGPLHVGNRREIEIAFFPEHRPIAVADHFMRKRRPIVRPREEVDFMGAVAINYNRRRPARDMVDATACKRETFRRKIRNRRRNIDATGEPWLHGVVIARDDVDCVMARQRACVRIRY